MRCRTTRGRALRRQRKRGGRTPFTRPRCGPRSERMTAEEVARVLALISAHYWQTPGVADRNVDLMIGTWQMVLADVPWTPYGEKALEWWLTHQKWPPQAAELRSRARELMRD